MRGLMTEVGVPIGLALMDNNGAISVTMGSAESPALTDPEVLLRGVASGKLVGRCKDVPVIGRIGIIIIVLVHPTRLHVWRS